MIDNSFIDSNSRPLVARSDGSRRKNQVVFVSARGDEDQEGFRLGTTVLVVDDTYELSEENLARLVEMVYVCERAAPCGKRTGTWPGSELSKTELRVLRYLPTNLTRPDIARELYVSVNTVNTHVRNIYSKLDAGSRAEAVERARELCLLAH